MYSWKCHNGHSTVGPPINSSLETVVDLEYSLGTGSLGETLTFSPLKIKRCSTEGVFFWHIGISRVFLQESFRIRSYKLITKKFAKALPNTFLEREKRLTPEPSSLLIFEEKKVSDHLQLNLLVKSCSGFILFLCLR